jgi:hypothetical protein
MGVILVILTLAIIGIAGRVIRVGDVVRSSVGGK